MNYLVISDTHGMYAHAKRCIEMQCGSIDGVLHLGDGAADVVALRRLFPDIPIEAVLGNTDSCDYIEYHIYREKIIHAGDKTIFMCHGDSHAVSGGRTHLATYTKRRNADIALYGHLHIAREEYFPADDAVPNDRPTWVFSPGSIAFPRDGRPSFGLLHIDADGVLFSIGRI